ncbi:hypothetical protein EB796_008914 [Bugula neritina]|uniref:Uncharacterized protein n=1 Tax=Bugula neritina TaxID=10212 RepID=A0A7J7K3H0_BUGNE|nr:hypothetical protein EB796_008914 [Bugula neritina]
MKYKFLVKAAVARVSKMNWRGYLAVLACILTYIICEAEAGRYSYSGGSSYRSGSSYSYRSSSSYRSTYRSYRSTYRSYRSTYRSYRGKVKPYKGSLSSYRGPVYVNYYDAQYAGYDVYGMTSYRSRYYGTKNYDEDPTVCTTATKLKHTSGQSGSVNDTEAGTSSGLYYFVCPYSSTDTVKDKFCCGPSDSQYCCPYWKRYIAIQVKEKTTAKCLLDYQEEGRSHCRDCAGMCDTPPHSGSLLSLQDLRYHRKHEGSVQHDAYLF